MRLKVGAASLGVALLSLALLSAVNVVIFRGMAERDRLESKNSCEETMNGLFASLRDHDDFGSAIESSAALRSSIIGLGVYSAAGASVYSWGATPASYSAPDSVGREIATPGRSYIENPGHDSVVLLLHPFRLIPPPPHGDRRAGNPPAEGPAPGIGQPQGKERPQTGAGPNDHSFFFRTLRDAEVVYLEIRQPAFWRAQRLREVLFPLTEVLLALAVFLVRRLVLRNAEYRRRIEEQRSLVVLGTAASTLAHEIKNPLLSIRLQSSILDRLCPDEARRELAIINAEVDRLTAISYRVNDWLRDPVGRPEIIDLAAAVRESSFRLLGRDVVTEAGEGSRTVRMDPERFRSIIDNLLRNAMEAVGEDAVGEDAVGENAGIALEVARREAAVVVEVLDRGPGVPPEDRDRVFDPFFTTKSRGTGIGLAVARRFVEAAGGKISMEGREGGGCRVRIVFRAADAKEKA